MLGSMVSGLSIFTATGRVPSRLALYTCTQSSISKGAKHQRLPYLSCSLGVGVDSQCFCCAQPAAGARAVQGPTSSAHRAEGSAAKLEQLAVWLARDLDSGGLNFPASLARRAKRL